MAKKYFCILFLYQIQMCLRKLAKFPCLLLDHESRNIRVTTRAVDIANISEIL